MPTLSPFTTSLLGPREDGADPDSEVIQVNPSDNHFHHPSGITPVNHSNYHHIPTAREYEPAGLNFLMMTSAITWIMLPGVGFFYSGMARQKSALHLMMLCLWSCAIVSVQWYLVGFTLCLSNTGGKLIGNLDHLLMREIGDRPSFTHDQVPLLLVSVWYCLFAAITPTVFLGAIAERARFLPIIIFIFLWTTLVFDFLCYWTWNKNGWSFQIGSLDFGGGTPVHISSGASALAFAIMVGRRENMEELPPQNMNNVYLGTSFIWCGWLVANAGSGLYPHIRAVAVFVTTNLGLDVFPQAISSASTGGITWGIIDYIRHGRKWSALGFCAGAICGLVCITPGSGYVTPSSALLFGFCGALCCNLAMGSKKLLRVDDAFDVFACHGVGGIVGNILTGVFAQRAVAAVDGQHIHGGWLDGNWAQVGYQVVDSAAGFAWAFGITLVLLFFIDKFPGCHLRAPPEDQEIGMDRTDLGVGLYEHLDDLSGNNNNNFPVAPKRVSVIATAPSTAGGGPLLPVPLGTAPPPVPLQSPNVIAISTINGDMNGVPGSAGAPNSFQNHYYIKNNGYSNNNNTNGTVPNNAVMVMAGPNGYIVPSAAGIGNGDNFGSVIGMVGGEPLARVETTEHI